MSYCFVHLFIPFLFFIILLVTLPSSHASCLSRQSDSLSIKRGQLIFNKSPLINLAQAEIKVLEPKKKKIQIKSILTGLSVIPLIGLPIYFLKSRFSGSDLKDSGFIQSLLLIFVSEVGDKTFFSAGLLAAKHGKLISFIGSMSALIAMTGISILLGQLIRYIPPSLTNGLPYDKYIAILAFSYFGLSTLYEAYNAPSDSSRDEELHEAEKLVNSIDTQNHKFQKFKFIVQTFSLIFAAEVGDRSCLSTIAMSATWHPLTVAIGALLANGAATLIAVFTGSLISQFLSEKYIGYIGGSLFILFALNTSFSLLTK